MLEHIIALLHKKTYMKQTLEKDEYGDVGLLVYHILRCWAPKKARDKRRNAHIHTGTYTHTCASVCVYVPPFDPLLFFSAETWERVLKPRFRKMSMVLDKLVNVHLHKKTKEMKKNSTNFQLEIQPSSALHGILTCTARLKEIKQESSLYRYTTVKCWFSWVIQIHEASEYATCAVVTT